MMQPQWWLNRRGRVAAVLSALVGGSVAALMAWVLGLSPWTIGVWTAVGVIAVPVMVGAHYGLILLGGVNITLDVWRAARGYAYPSYRNGSSHHGRSCPEF
jgi:hypothetical protein